MGNIENLSEVQDGPFLSPLSNKTNSDRPPIIPESHGDAQCGESSEGSGDSEHVLQVGIQVGFRFRAIAVEPWRSADRRGVNQNVYTSLIGFGVNG